VHITYLSGSAQLGGAERCLLDVMVTVHAEQPQWSLSLITTGDGPLVQRARSLGLRVEVVAIPPALAALGDFGARGGVVAFFGEDVTAGLKNVLHALLRLDAGRRAAVSS